MKLLLAVETIGAWLFKTAKAIAAWFITIIKDMFNFCVELVNDIKAYKNRDKDDKEGFLLCWLLFYLILAGALVTLVRLFEFIFCVFFMGWMAFDFNLIDIFIVLAVFTGIAALKTTK